MGPLPVQERAEQARKEFISRQREAARNRDQVESEVEIRMPGLGRRNAPKPEWKDVTVPDLEEALRCPNSRLYLLLFLGPSSPSPSLNLNLEINLNLNPYDRQENAPVGAAAGRGGGRQRAPVGAPSQTDLDAAERRRVWDENQAAARRNRAQVCENSISLIHAEVDSLRCVYFLRRGCLIKP
jgi:hypothetical protein